MAMPPVMKNKQKSISKKTSIPNEGKSNVMMGKQFTGTQKPGVSSQEQKKQGGNGPVGGKTKMFGKQTSKAQVPGRSSSS